MDWTDILVKIGVGACLGFGIIVVAKLVRKKNDQDQKSSHSPSTVKPDMTSRKDTSRND